MEWKINFWYVTTYVCILQYQYSLNVLFVIRGAQPSLIVLMLLVGSSGSVKCSEWLTDLCTKVDDKCLYVANPSEYTVSPVCIYLFIYGCTSAIDLPSIGKQRNKPDYLPRIEKYHIVTPLVGSPLWYLTRAATNSSISFSSHSINFNFQQYSLNQLNTRVAVVTETKYFQEAALAVTLLKNKTMMQVPFQTREAFNWSSSPQIM
ncbi:Hypothetical_protein [Hexamita inflata]|uniref:Hypothetical_protein n=1 Tax=Hexamita inflata TaxID=28002 RepID=A0AA86PH89_9EUKA|nr:Hypothetical protein HINF_LOCUS25961 [Hexamita inflata]